MLASYPASMRVMIPLGHHIRTETGNFARICSISASYQNKSVQVNNKFVGYIEGSVAFPRIKTFPKCDPGPYERQMGRYILGILNAFSGHVPDSDSHALVTMLAATPEHWTAGHAVFDEIRGQLLRASDRNDALRSAQYTFEESCCQAMYNATDPVDPFDPSSAFFVVGQALGLASVVGISLDTIAMVFTQIE